MVRIYERPVTAREAEGRVQTAQLLKWLQYSRYIPSSSESRLLQLGIDELFSRTIDMTTLSVMFSVRLWSGWMRMSFAKRWMVPIYASLVISDRRRAMNVMKFDSTYATLAAISQLDSPMGREAKRLIEQSQPRLKEFKKTKEAQKLDYQVARYLRQVFYLYSAFGPAVGAVISHACLWNTMHDVLEGSALFHTFAPGDEEDQSIAHDLQQQHLIEAMKEKEEKKKENEGSNKDSKKSAAGLGDGGEKRSFADMIKATSSGWTTTEKSARAGGDNDDEQKKIISTSLDDDDASSEETKKKIEEAQKKLKEQKEKMQKKIDENGGLSTVWVNYQLNIRWFRWQVFEVSSVSIDGASTVAFSFGAPAVDDRNDFVANDLRRCGSSAMLNWWFPARLWWKARWMFVSYKPPTPVLPSVPSS